MSEQRCGTCGEPLYKYTEDGWPPRHEEGGFFSTLADAPGTTGRCERAGQAGGGLPDTGGASETPAPKKVGRGPSGLGSNAPISPAPERIATIRRWCEFWSAKPSQKDTVGVAYVRDLLAALDAAASPAPEPGGDSHTRKL